MIVIFLLLFGGVAIGFLWILVALPLWLIDWLVFKVWLGRKSDKYDRFYELSLLWLTWSFKLPFRMSERGAKYGLLGAGLMLVSPAAIATYAAAYCVQQTCFPFPLSEKDVPYKTHDDLVAITELKDFPAFTYSHNSRDGWDGSVTIYYKFVKKLSSAYAKKLEALCNDPDNYLWYKSEDNEYNLKRGFDGKYIKSPIKDAQIKLSISQSGFVVIIPQAPNITDRIEDFAERDSLNKNTGVTFPQYKLVNYEDSNVGPDYAANYYLLLDDKPSKRFIKQLENSPKWEKDNDGTYCCEWGEYNSYSVSVTVDKNSRVVKTIYQTY